MISTYLNLLEEIHRLTLLPKYLLSPELTHLSIHDVNFSMHVVDDQYRDQIVIHCELGELPASRREEVLIRLLDTNFHMVSAGKSVAFCRNEYSGRIMLSLAQPISGVSGQSVLDQMRSLADYALIWRKSYFISEDLLSQLASSVSHQSTVGGTWRATNAPA